MPPPTVFIVKNLSRVSDEKAAEEVFGYKSLSHMTMRIALTLMTCLMASALVATPGARAVLVQPRAAVSCNFLSEMITKLQAGSYDEEAVAADVQRMIDRKPCVMFSLSSCPFCTQTKEILDGMGVMYTCLDLDTAEVENGMPMKAELAKIIGRTSLPAVFAGGKFLGGCNDGGLGGVATLKKSGELATLLQASGAYSPTQRI